MTEDQHCNGPRDCDHPPIRETLEPAKRRSKGSWREFRALGREHQHLTTCLRPKVIPVIDRCLLGRRCHARRLSRGGKPRSFSTSRLKLSRVAATLVSIALNAAISPVPKACCQELFRRIRFDVCHDNRERDAWPANWDIGYQFEVKVLVVNGGIRQGNGVGSRGQKYNSLAGRD
jgi:hypothetical protein